MENDWENLTDPILLNIFSFLGQHELNTASKTCKNWYRVAQDESLWKGLAFKTLGSSFTHSNVSWKSELKRLTYHTPVHLHQTCEEHEDEVYNVCFSNSGQFIATCGLDGYVKVWKFGETTELIHSRKVVDPPSYVNFVEFNESETHLLLNCMTGDDGWTSCLLAVLSLEKDFAVVAARHAWFPNFRGTWLSDNIFLNADVLAYFFSNDNVKLVACEFDDHDLVDPELLERPLQDHLSDNNVDMRCILEIRRFEYRPHFAKVIDWSEWNQDSASKRNEDSEEANIKLIILYQQSLEWNIDCRIAFFKVDVDSEVPSTAEPIKIVIVNSGCLGVNLSSDHRSITYNLRSIYEDGDRSWYDREVATMVVNLANLEEKPEIFNGIRSLEQSSSLMYFFPNISPDYIVSGSEEYYAVLWDRRSKLIVSKLSHQLPDPEAQNGVSAVAFHPRDQEVVVSVADDCKLRIWMSSNRKRQMQSS